MRTGFKANSVFYHHHQEGTAHDPLSDGDITILHHRSPAAVVGPTLGSGKSWGAPMICSSSGVNIFPSQIEEALLAMGHTEPHYVLVVDRERGLDELEVWVELTREAFIDEVRRIEELERQIKRGIEETLGIGVQVRLVEPKTIARSEGKAKRIIDRREIK